MLTKLRVFLILNIVASIVTAILVKYYDPTVSPLIAELYKTQVANIISSGTTGLATFISLAEIIMALYSLFALWFNRPSGKWTFLIYNILGCTDYFFIKVIALSWVSMFALNVNLILSGITLAIAFSLKKPLNCNQ